MFEIMPFDRRTYRMSCYNPLRELEQMEKSFWGEQQVNPFRTDISETADGYKLEAELPGFRKEDISLTVKEDVLTVAAHREKEQQAGQYVCRERPTGDVRRSVDASAIEQEGSRAAFDHGVLVLTLPKASAVKPERRSISIQ